MNLLTEMNASNFSGETFQQHVEFDVTRWGFSNTVAMQPGGDEDQIVNEQEQNEIVNPSEDTFNESPATQPEKNDHPGTKDENSTTEQRSNVEDMETSIDADEVESDKDVQAKG